jgi:hypothetical protein
VTVTIHNINFSGSEIRKVCSNVQREHDSENCRWDCSFWKTLRSVKKIMKSRLLAVQ